MSTTHTFTAPAAPGFTVRATHHTDDTYSAEIRVDGQLASSGDRRTMPDDHGYTDRFSARAQHAVIEFAGRVHPNVPRGCTWQHRVGVRPWVMMDHLSDLYATSTDGDTE